MFRKLFLVTGPSGSGKSTLLDACVYRAEPGVRQIDMDDMFSESADGIENRYDVRRVLEWVRDGQPGGIGIAFGLSRNILQVVRSLQGACRQGNCEFQVLVMRPGMDEIVARRRARGKAFDLSLDDAGHRRDVSSFDQVFSQIRTRSLKTGTVDELFSIVFAGDTGFSGQGVSA